MDRVVKFVIRGDVTDGVAKMKALSTSIGATAKSMTDSSKEAAMFRQNLSAVGDTAGRLGLSATLGIGLAVRAFANFDEAISHVAATGLDAKLSIDALREASLDAGSRTAYSATEAANAVEELAKAGVSAKDILGGALDGSLDLAAAGGLQVADAASIAATTLNQFSLKGTEASHVADLLSGAANAAQGSVQDVGQALKYVGPVAAQMGVSLEETTGTIAELASQGILADQAGTALRGMLTALTSPSKIAADTMGELGINVYDAQGKFVGFKGIAGQLKETMSGLGDAERDQALGRIFGNEQITAARILYAGGAEDVAKWTDAINISGGAAAVANERMNNLKGDIEELGGALETAFIGSASGADGPLRDLTQQLTGLVNQYNKLPAPLQSAAFGLAAVTAALGVGLFATSKTLTAYVQMKDALTNLGTTGATTAKALKGVGQAALAFAAVDLGASIGDSFDARNSKDIDKMAASLENLVKTGKATGDLEDLFGDDLHGKTVRFGKDLGGIGEAIKSLEGYADDSSLTEFGKFLGSAGQSAGIVAQAEAIQDLDRAFTVLSETDPEGAIAAFEKVRDQALDTGANVKDVAAAFPTMTQALQSAASSTGQASDATSVLTGNLQELAPAAQQASEDQRKLDDANRETANAFLDISQGVDDAKVSLSDWITQMSDQATALQAFGDNAAKAGKRGLEDGLIASLRELGPAGAQRLKELADASDSELERANKAWRKGQRAAEEYVDEFGHVPSEVSTQVKTPGLTTAIANAGSLRAALLRIPDLTETTIRTIEETYKVPKKSDPKPSLKNMLDPNMQANGSVLRFFASGGIREQHVAEIASAGAMRVWAEPETGGEAYIPLADSKRVRSRAIAQQTVGLLGGHVEWFADGGITKATKLEIKEAEARVRDIQRDLDARETVKRDGKKVTRDVLRGLDREIAKLQLSEAKKTLADLKSNKAYNQDQADLAAEREKDAEAERQKLRDDAAAEAERAEANRLSVKSSYGANFKIAGASSAASLERRLDRTIADANTFMGLLGDLKAQGASPWLLEQLIEEGPTKAAIRLAREYATNSTELASINARAGQIDALTNSYAGMVSNPAFMAPGAWNSGVNSSSTQNFNINVTDPSAFTQEIDRRVRHILATAGAGGGL